MNVRPRTLKAAILVVSTTASKDKSTDLSGSILREVLEKEILDGESKGRTWEVVETRIVSDDVLLIQRAIMNWSDVEHAPNLIVTTGGTGFAIHDRTPEAITPLLHKQASGLVHGMLAASLVVTPFALVSRPVAGIREKTLIITLPGSPKGARENLESVLKVLPHACQQATGADSRVLHQGGVKRLENEAGVGNGYSQHHPHPSRDGHLREHAHSHGHAMPVRHTTSSNEPTRSSDPALGPTRRHRSSPYPMLSVAEAIRLIEDHMPSPRIVTAKVDGSLVGYVLAEDIEATEAVPAYQASIVDGYAVVAPENGGSSKGIFPVVSVSHARPGEIPPLRPGQIARITTGAPLPRGATSVVMVEDTVLQTITNDGTEELEVEIRAESVKAGENVREVGSDIAKGDIILRKGDEISAIGGELGLLSSVGRAEVTVYKRPVVGVLSTGDEIVEHDRPGGLHPGEVRDSNRPAILSATRGWGFEAIDLGIARDTPGGDSEDLERILRDGLRQVDVIITSGGVSMGELDLLKPTIERSFGGTIYVGRVSMKPGKPMTFATVPVGDTTTVRKAVFALPGNPVSAIVTFHLFVLPALHSASGVRPPGLPRARVTLDHPMCRDPLRDEYHRAIVTVGRDARLHARGTGVQRSSRLGSFNSANALLCLPAGNDLLPAGAIVDALLMGKLNSE